MENDGIRFLKKLFHTFIVVLILLQCFNPSLSSGFNNVSFGFGAIGHREVMRCIESEREALLAFKQGLVDGHNLLSSWGSEVHKQDCCKWIGVHCSNRTGHVTQLSLGSYDLFEAYSLQQKGHRLVDCCRWYLQGKMMSPKLIELQHLKYLDLSFIDFNGTRLPDFIGSLSNLRYLYLCSALFGGRFPTQVGNLTHLQHLDLSYNYFANVENLNSWLPRLSSLTYLDLSRSNLSNVPDWLEIPSKLPKLTNLTLWGCSLASPPIHSSTLFNINSSKFLAHVELGNNNLTSSSSSIFVWLSKYNDSLVTLDLYLNQIEGEIPQFFSNLCNLQELYLQYNTLSGQLSRLVQILLSACPDQNSLETLDLSYNHLSGSIPNLINFSSLKKLNLYQNQLSGTIPESIGHMSKLKTIDLGMNALEGVVSESHFSNLSRLTSLSLASNSLALNFSSNWIPPFQLDTILLSSCIMGPHFPKWLQTQKSYKTLYISNVGISDILPTWFWSSLSLQDMSLQDTGYNFDLSNNQIRGTIPNSRFEFPSPSFNYVNLSRNQLEGLIPSFLSKASILDLSNNKLSGLSSFLCPNTPNKVSYLVFLDLSSNNLYEQLPNCWTRFENLVILDFSDNALFGEIPTTMGSLSSIRTLKL